MSQTFQNIVVTDTTTSTNINTSNINATSANIDVINCDELAVDSFNTTSGTLYLHGSTINIGDLGSTINLIGDLNYINTEQVQVKDNLITLNKGGLLQTAVGGGIEIESNDEIVASIKLDNNKDWVIDSSNNKLTADNIKVNNTLEVQNINITATEVAVNKLLAQNVNVASLTGNRVVLSDGSDNLVSSSVSSQTLSYLDVNSSVQTQLNSKVNRSGDTITGTLTLNNLTANKWLKLDANKNIIGVDNEQPVVSTANRVLISDGSRNIVSSNTTTTTLGFLDATSSIQTQLNGKADDNTVVKLTGNQDINGMKTFNSNVKLGINNRLLSTGTDRVYYETILNDAKFACITGGADNIIYIRKDGNVGMGTSTPLEKLHITNGNVRIDNLTPNRAVITDGSDNLISSLVTNTELSYLTGSTSSIQNQLDTKVNKNGDVITGTLTLNNLTADKWLKLDASKNIIAVDNNQPVVSTANRVIVSDSTLNLISSSVTTTQLGYLSGVTSNIQTQLNGKFNLTAFAGYSGVGPDVGNMNIGFINSGGGSLGGKIQYVDNGVFKSVALVYDFDFAGIASNQDIQLRYFRTTNTTGVKRLILHRGNNTNNIDTQLGVDGTDTFFNNCNVGISTSTPQAKLHIVQTGTQPVLRCDDQSNDTSYFFIDADGRVKINTDVNNTDTEQLVVNGTTRLKNTLRLENSIIVNNTNISPTELSYLDNCSSNIQLQLLNQQDQIDTKPTIYANGNTTPANYMKQVYGTGATLTTGGLTINFSPSFLSAPIVVATIRDGDATNNASLNITSISGSSFTIEARAVNQDRVARNFHWIALGGL